MGGRSSHCLSGSLKTAVLESHTESFIVDQKKMKKTPWHGKSWNILRIIVMVKLTTSTWSWTCDPVLPVCPGVICAKMRCRRCRRRCVVAQCWSVTCLGVCSLLLTVALGQPWLRLRTPSTSTKRRLQGRAKSGRVPRYHEIPLVWVLAGRFAVDVPGLSHNMSEKKYGASQTCRTRLVSASSNIWQHLQQAGFIHPIMPCPRKDVVVCRSSSFTSKCPKLHVSLINFMDLRPLFTPQP